MGGAPPSAFGFPATQHVTLSLLSSRTRQRSMSHHSNATFVVSTRFPYNPRNRHFATQLSSRLLRGVCVCVWLDIDTSWCGVHWYWTTSRESSVSKRRDFLLTRSLNLCSGLVVCSSIPNRPPRTHIVRRKAGIDGVHRPLQGVEPGTCVDQVCAG